MSMIWGSSNQWWRKSYTVTEKVREGYLFVEFWPGRAKTKKFFHRTHPRIFSLKYVLTEWKVSKVSSQKKKDIRHSKISKREVRKSVFCIPDIVITPWTRNLTLKFWFERQYTVTPPSAISPRETMLHVSRWYRKSISASELDNTSTK